MSPARRALPVPLALAVAATLTAGCSGAEHAATAHAKPAAVACRRLPPGHLPHAAGTLTDHDTGTYCLAPGAQVDVFLTAPAARPGRRANWTPVTSSAPRILHAADSGVLTPPLGVTPGVFTAVAPGVAALTSHRPGGGSWRVLVVVR